MTHRLYRIVAALLITAAGVAVSETHVAEGMVSVAEYGAIPNDRGDDSAAFQRALDALLAEGGGRLEIPASTAACSKWAMWGGRRSR
ncbi:hypothetical protein [Kiritimatiella glycovorans]|nr:hypothetical protein [Kiritimatiella glycovorans]